MVPRPGLNAAQIVDEAAELADRLGLQHFTFRELAEKLGVKPPSLYNHVASLDAVHQALTLRAISVLTDQMRSAAVGRQGLDALRGIAHAERNFARQHPGLFAALQRNVEDQNEEVRAAGHELLGVVLAVLRGYALGGEVVIHAARALHAALTGFALLESRTGFGLPTETDRSFEWLIEMLDAGLRANGAANKSLPSTGERRASQ